MEAKHAGRAGQTAAERTGPERTEPRSGEPVGMAEAIETVTEFLDVAWVRQFDQHRNADGSTFYVDVTTGKRYDTLPDMHQKDGLDV